MADSKLAKESPAARAFLDELIKVCRKHGMSLAHEDSGGAFIVEDLNGNNIDWLRDAIDQRGRA